MNALSAPLTKNNGRINARIAPRTAEQIATLKAALGVSISDILRDSIAMYEAAMTKKKPAPGTALKKIIGKYSSNDPNGSVNYKAHVAAYLDKKYPKNYE
jgi:hypothetical protein